MLLDKETCPAKLALSGETETGSAGEQPVRDSRIQNEREPKAQSCQATPRFLILAMPKKTQSQNRNSTRIKQLKMSQPISGLDKQIECLCNLQFVNPYEMPSEKIVCSGYISP